MQNLCSTFRTCTEERAMACNKQQRPLESQNNQLPHILVKIELKNLAMGSVLYFYYFLKLVHCWNTSTCWNWLQLCTIFPVNNLHNPVLHTPKHSHAAKYAVWLVSRGIQHSHFSDGCFSFWVGRQTCIPC